MNKIYYVVIKGKTLESRDLKELLARAVTAKRNLDRKAQIQARLQRRTPVQTTSNLYAEAPRTAAL